MAIFHSFLYVYQRVCLPAWEATTWDDLDLVHCCEPGPLGVLAGPLALLLPRKRATETLCLRPFEELAH